MNDVEWFVILNGKSDGPYSVPELLRNKEVNSNTLAWREGMEKWLPIREIPELKLLFIENEAPPVVPQEVDETDLKAEDAVIALPSVQPPWIFWILFIILLLVYVLHQFYFN